MEDLHRREVSKRFWEEEQERIDLGTCCLCPAAFGKYGLHTDRHSGMIMFWDGRTIAAAHVRPSQNTQERCATPTHPVYHRFSATPALAKYLFSRTGSHSLFEQLHAGLLYLC